MPFLDETRRRKGDGADVVAVNKGDDGGPDDQLDVERAHSILIEEMRDLNVCRRRHCSSRKKLFYTPRKGMWHAYARWAKGSSQNEGRQRLTHEVVAAMPGRAGHPRSRAAGGLAVQVRRGISRTHDGVRAHVDFALGVAARALDRGRPADAISWSSCGRAPCDGLSCRCSTWHANAGMESIRCRAYARLRRISQRRAICYDAAAGRSAACTRPSKTAHRCAAA